MADKREYILTDPEGNEHRTSNLTAFCKERGLWPNNLRKVAQGKSKSAQGWTARYAEEAESSGREDSGSALNSDSVVFLFRIGQSSEIVLDEYDDDEYGKLDYARDMVFQFMDAIAFRVMEDGQYFIVLPPNGNSPEYIVSTFSLPMLNTGSDEAPVLSEKAESQEMYIAGITSSGIDHWDYNFLKASETFAGNFEVIGPHPDYEVARQSYDDGEYDSGIQVDPEDESYTEVDESLQRYLKLETYNGI